MISVLEINLQQEEQELNAQIALRKGQPLNTKTLNKKYIPTGSKQDRDRRLRVALKPGGYQQSINRRMKKLNNPMRRVNKIVNKYSPRKSSGKPSFKTNFY